MAIGPLSDLNTLERQELILWIAFFKLSKLKEVSKAPAPVFQMVKDVFHNPLEIETDKLELFAKSFKEVFDNDSKNAQSEHDKLQLRAILFWATTLDMIHKGQILQVQLLWDELEKSHSNLEKLSSEIKTSKDYSAEQLVILSHISSIRFDEIRPSFLA